MAFSIFAKAREPGVLACLKLTSNNLLTFLVFRNQVDVVANLTKFVELDVG